MNMFKSLLYILISSFVIKTYFYILLLSTAAVCTDNSSEPPPVHHGPQDSTVRAVSAYSAPTEILLTGWFYFTNPIGHFHNQDIRAAADPK